MTLANAALVSNMHSRHVTFDSFFIIIAACPMAFVYLGVIYGNPSCTYLEKCFLLPHADVYVLLCFMVGVICGWPIAEAVEFAREPFQKKGQVPLHEEFSRVRKGTDIALPPWGRRRTRKHDSNQVQTENNVLSQRLPKQPSTFEKNMLETSLPN